MIGVRLSMVGPYALVSLPDLEPVVASRDADLTLVFDLLGEMGISALSREILEKVIPLNLGEGDGATVFCALFSHVEELPWEGVGGVGA